MWVCAYICVFDNGGVFLCSQCGVFDLVKWDCIRVFGCWDLLYCRWELFSEIVQLLEKL